MAANAWDDWTLRGYGTAIAPLYNNGKLNAIDLHTYYDVDYAPMENNYTNSSQSNFDNIKSTCGITADVKFSSTEFNYKLRNVTEAVAAKGMLTGIWDNLGIVGNSGQSVSQFALAWNLYNTNASNDDPEYGLCTTFNPWTPVTRGVVLKMVCKLTEGMWFTSLNPKTTGTFVLAGNNKTMWVFQNRTGWTNQLGTSFTVTGIPTTATSLKIYRSTSTETSPWQTINLSGQTSYTVTGLTTEESYMFVADGLDGNGPVQGVLVSPSAATIKAGSTLQLTKTFSPVNPNNINVTWSSSNEAIATVDQSGLVKGITAGDVNITVTTEDGGFASSTQLTVEPSFQVNHTQGGMYIDGKIEEADWALNNLIAKPTGGIQNNEGYFDLLWDENYLYVGVTVMDSEIVFSPTINPWENDAIEIYIDGNQNKGTFYDEFDVQLIQTTGSDAIWSSRPISGIYKAVSVIDGGYSMEFAIPWSVVKTSAVAGSGIGFDITYDDNDTGKRDGSTTWYGDGNNFSNTSNFDDLIFLAGSTTNIAVTGVVLDSTSVSIMVGDNRQINASVSPINAANKNIVWSSSNASIATVNQSGLINALSNGESTVSVKTNDGNFQATCLVTSKSIITSNDEDAGGTIKVFPNPVSEGKIYLSNVSGSVSIKITDALGKIIYRTTMIANGILEIDDLKLRSGAYFLSVQNGTRVFKLIVK